MSGTGMRKMSVAALIYAVGDLLTKGARFILIPFYVRYLSKEEVGALAILQVISFAIAPVFSGGLPMAVARFYQEYKERGDAFVSSLWCAGLGITALGCSLVCGLVLLMPTSWSDHLAPSLLLLAAFAGFSRSNSSILEKKYIIRQEPMKYRTFTFLQFLSTTGLIFILVAVLKLGLFGAILGEAIGYGIWMLISAGLIFKAARPRFREVNWRNIFTYCVPLAPHVIFMWGISYSDRLILKRYVDFEDLALYNSAYLIASLLPTFTLAMKNAWLPRFFRHADEDRNSGKNFSGVFTLYLAVSLFMALGLVVEAPVLVDVLLTPAYRDSIFTLQMVAIGLTFHAVFIVLINPLYYAQRTKTIALISGSTMTINVLCNFFFIPRMGFNGAALATLYAYAAGAIFCWIASRKVYRLNLEFKRMAVIAALFLTIALAGIAVPLERGLWLEGIVRLAATLTFPLLLLLIPNLVVDRAVLIRLLRTARKRIAA
jgi:O-antigen/teichoic acid export membrane protein